MSAILCVIPARGGSKGIPRKNVLPVAGRPLIEWTIAQALAARPRMDVVVSTDDDEIAAVAAAAGAFVPFRRPSELAHDTTATEPVIRHALDHMRSIGREPEAVMLLQATSPIRLPGTLDRAIAQFEATGADSLVGVVPQAPFLWWMGEADGQPPRADYDVRRRPRRQDLTPAQLRYRETGSLYLTRPEIYDREDNRLGGRISLFVMAEIEGVDIDTDVDLALTEATLRDLEQNPR